VGTLPILYSVSIITYSPYKFFTLTRHLTWRITKFSTKKNLILLGILSAALLFFVYPAAEKDLYEWTGSQVVNGLQLFLTPGESLILLHCYPSETKQFYVFYLLTIDLISPMIYALFFSAVFAKIRHLWFPDLPGHRILTPLLVFCLHTIKNVGFISMMHFGGGYFDLLLWTTWLVISLNFILKIIVLIDLLRCGNAVIHQAFSYLQNQKIRH